MMRQVQSKMGYRRFAMLMSVLIGAMLYVFFLQHVTEETYDVQLFQLADETIRASKTVEDPIRTELERQRAAEDVPQSYQFHEEIARNQSTVIESFFTYILDIKEPLPGEPETKVNTSETMLTALREQLRTLEAEQAELRLTDSMLLALLEQPEAVLQRVSGYLQEQVDTSLKEPVRETEVQDVQDAIEQRIRENNTVPAAIVQPAVMIGRAGIIPTETVDEELTAAQREQARLSVEPTRILQGQVLVQDGQVIDREVYRQLELAGLTDQQNSYVPRLGLLLFVLVLTVLLILAVSRTEKDERRKIDALFVTATVLLLTLIIMQLISTVEGEFDVTIAFLFPAALGGMIAVLLTDERIAVLITAVTAASAGLMLISSYAGMLQAYIVLYVLFGGLAGIYLVRPEDRGSRLLQKSLLVSAVNVLFVGFYLLVNQSQHGIMEVAYYIGAAFASGLLSGALAVGLLPLFESAFGILSTLRLVELSNPNHPLLRRILTETPGTYHHSVMVANLADAACEEIGANGLLARVGSYYHDIGKTIHPVFFIENQVNMRNPHDTIEPEKSRDIILAHSPDGAAVLKQYKMPQEIIDIAAQHHGTSLLKFFYFKAKEQDPDVNEKDYRYIGPKPQTKETAVISLADSVEAAVRSMKEPSPEKIRNLVNAIVEDKVKDGQLDDCDLTLHELKIVKRVFCETLNGIFHSRIEYPKD
ncbi:HD family phosphohydrolase [Planococcus lenghuensis]|uniref:Phosphohydrolase n=1 Tax=Planococcus lenghuensis TaxID=2213202 RepID=A0A1Q2KYU4_9BACL|nr:HDIG domain-containing metalloprotein [Planococcus lenghuensis]AQQ52967.1 phosphohydrolase [Planococcus lenghuensis]